MDVADTAAGAAAATGGVAGGARQRELLILNRVAEALNSAADVQQALEHTLALVAELLGLRTGWVWLRDAETGGWWSAAARHLPPYLQNPVRMVGYSCWCIESFEDGELTAKNVDVMECSRLRPAALTHRAELTHGLQYHASIPLYFRDRPLGIMNVAAPAWRRLAPAELRLLATIAYQVGIAVERARLAEGSARLARAEERARLAREIHDTLAQDLTAIALHLESALRHLGDDPAGARARLERALATTRQSLEEARRSVLDLRAAPLAGQPLAAALAALSRAFSAETGVRVHLQADDTLALPLRVEAELYRIAQEALNNVRQHARAQTVEITLERAKERLRLRVRDDGAGFAAETRRAEGQGLRGMEERARLIGGRLRVTSRLGKGTSMLVTLPLEGGTA